jgi:AraC family transcriptional activator of mtrCDE
VTLGEFLTAVRMTLACRLLRETSHTLTDIAAEVGYQSDASFAKAFRSSVGLTPGQWRRQTDAASRR